MNNLKRLHIAAIFVSFLHVLKTFLLPLLFSLFIGGSREPIGFFRFEYIWIGIVMIILINGIGQWITFRYQMKDGELYVQKGIFVKKKRYIQQSRVQSIDISAGIVQRMFGLVRLKVETAGGGKEPEVNLIAIRREEAEKIRSELLRKDVLGQMNSVDEGLEEQEALIIEEPEQEESYVWQLKKRRLFITALTSSGIGLAISAVIALFSQVEQFVPESIYENAFGFLSRSGLFLVFILILLVILVAWSISFIGTVLKYGGFKIEKLADDLVISRGLLEQRQLTIHTGRVTAVRIVRNIFRQPFGYAAVYVESAGGGSSDEQLSTVLLPIVKEDEIIPLFAEILPEYSFEHEIMPIPKRALLRSLIRVTLIPLVISISIGIGFTDLGYYGLIVVAICLVLGFSQYRDAGSGCNPTHLWIRFRKLSQITVLTSKKKVQSAEVLISPLQKRKTLASFRFSVLSSMSGKTFTVHDLEKKQAQYLLEWFRSKK